MSLTNSRKFLLVGLSFIYTTPNNNGKIVVETEEQTALQWRTARALLITLAFASVASAPIHLYQEYFKYPWAVAGTIAGLLAIIAFAHWYRNFLGRILASLSLVVWFGGSILSIPEQPGRGLFLLLALVMIFAYIWPAWQLLGPHFAGEDGAEREDLLIATLIALIVGIDKWQTSSDEFIVQAIALSATFAVPAIRAYRFAPKKGRVLRAFFYSMVTVCLVLALSPIAANHTLQYLYGHIFAPIGLFSPLLIALGLGWRFVLEWLAPTTRFRASKGGILETAEKANFFVGNKMTSTTLLDALLNNPARILVISFLMICIIGTAFLHLPLSSAKTAPLSWLVSAFTSVSATCVTGLTVINPVGDLTGFGQFVLLSLIQVGGIGIMVFSSAAILLLGGRLSLSSERAAVDMVGANSRSGLWGTIKVVFVVTFITESIAAVLLFAGFYYEGESLGLSIWKGIFTAISAFCNAGFALQPDSLVAYNHNPFIINTVGATIAIAGMGPPVVVAAIFWKNIEQRTLHARLVIIATLALILIPAFLILIFEWNTTLAEFGLIDKVTNALFQSVTLRTAGFNSIDLTQMRPISWTIMEVTMFIGGSPGSTAGGIKTTTMMVIILGVASVVRGEERIEIFGRTIPHLTVLRVSAIVTLGFLFFLFALTALQLTQAMELQTATFEVISAIATVGLSLDGTSQLDEIGMVIIMACMFAGRVGPISLFVFFAANDNRRHPKRFPEENIPVG